MVRSRGNRLDGGAAGCALAAMLAVTAVCLTAAGCVTGASPAALPEGGIITLVATPVPLNPADPTATGIGDFTYAGGIALTSADTPLLHGLSDLVVTDTAHLTAIGDEGVLFDAQLALGEGERLVGIANGRVALLGGEDGRPLSGKRSADAEGMAQLGDGSRLVSFERRHRILL